MSLQREKRQLLPEQAAAAYEIKKHISVTAGPGSGKTTVLVERYLHILRNNPHLNIDQIVAITFTNRAANEMRERLRAQLDLILQTSSDNIRRQWLNYKRTLDGAVITTIHGFCARLLREFPVEARVDPQFLLLDEHRAAMLLESVVEECLTEFISAGHVEISRLTLGVGRGKLAAALAQIYRDVRGQGLSLRELALKTAQSHATEADHANAVNDLTHAMNDFLSVRRTTPTARGKHAEVSSNWPDFKAKVATIPEVAGLAEYCRAVEGFRRFRPSAAGDLKPYVNALDSLVWESNLLGRIPQLSLDLFAKQYALEICLLLTRIDDRLNEEKAKISALDFDDLELRALEVLERPEVLTRAAERYKFFLVDEFQDTNGLQRRLLEKLALQKGRRESANLFIVGDPKQSIYSFRGADVAVFSAMTDTLLAAGGEVKPLLLNFRSQPPLIKFFNLLFERLFRPKDEVGPREREELGYVYHEPSDARRELRDGGPLVELMVTTEASGYEDDPKADQGSRELDAQQLALRIASLVNVEPGARRYSDVALLFRAMTQVRIYESAFRRANIPYQTVLGRGFYERQEITDLIQLLRFLDNKTDELALAAVLRSPLCGISDNALLAMRCAPWLDEVDAGDPLKHFTQTRKLVVALRRHREVAYISDDEHELLDRARDLIDGLTSRQHHYSLSKLLRFAVDRAEFFTVIAASFDGAQRLANVQRLFTLAERFEHAGAHLIRDFVRYVEEFEAIGSRESEGQIDEAANAVKLMTIHQAKGLEFPVVIIPELQRYSRMPDNWFLLDRHRGLTLKVPDGRGKLVAGCTFTHFEQRQAWREEFEGMRLLYVAATRAQDRLILSGTVKDIAKLGLKGETWINWIWQSLELPTPTQSTVIDLADDLQAQITLNLAEEPSEATPVKASAESTNDRPAESIASIAEAFPLLGNVPADRTPAANRFSVTQLINYRRCPRQYYFDRVVHAPTPDALAVWNNAEAPEPPANLTATLKGAVIHRFCETYATGNNAEELLRQSFDDVVRTRQSELADRLVDIKIEEAIADLTPLAQNYLASPVFERIERARAVLSVPPALAGGSIPGVDGGLWSELGFRLRRPLGILSGAIDKLLISRSPTGEGFEVEIIDFKTNRIRSPEVRRQEAGGRRQETGRGSRDKRGQFAFDFETPVVTKSSALERPGLSVEDQVRITASDYQLQMQAYALAVMDLIDALMPGLKQAGLSIKSTLHFLDPNVEFHLSEDLLVPDACARAIDDAMMDIVSSIEPRQFPVRPAMHCRMCNFLGICPPGRDWVRSAKHTTADALSMAATVES
ncbi:MAG TPA: UvrD-helicase domain-containing protein [Pyrinomonadaceae bacterium]|nr:UvrD-helicase domain-containing protein [Pyrinomonadaceae bacterium]